MPSALAVQIALSLINNITAPAQQASKDIQAIQKNIEALRAAGIRGGDSAMYLYKGLTDLRIGARRLALVFGAYYGAASGFAFMLGRTGIAAQKARMQLEALYGGRLRLASQAMESIRRLAKDTTLEFDDLAKAWESLVKVGADPNTLMTGITKAAGALGKSAADVGSAISMAMVGNYRGLKQLGIMVTTTKKAKDATVEWRDASGQLHKTIVANKTDAVAMGKALNEALMGRFGKFTDENSVLGQLDNLKDRLDAFVAIINEGPMVRGMRQGGLIDWLTQQMKDLNALLDQWEKDGTLTRFAVGVKNTIEGVLGSFRSMAEGLRSLFETITGREATTDDLARAIVGLSAAIVGIPILWAASPVIMGLGYLAAAVGALVGITGLAGLAAILAGIAGAIALFSDNGRKIERDMLEWFAGFIDRLSGGSLSSLAKWLSDVGSAWFNLAEDTKEPIKPEVTVNGAQAALDLIQALKDAWQGLLNLFSTPATGSVSVNQNGQFVAPGAKGAVIPGTAGGRSQPYSGPATAIPRAPARRFQLIDPAKKTSSVTQNTQVTANITINGAQDAKSMGKQVADYLRTTYGNDAVVPA